MSPKPDIVTSDGALCWHDRERVCGADCVAFNAESDDHDEPQSRCTILVIGGQIAPAIHQLVALKRKESSSKTQQPDLNPPLPKTKP